MRARRPFRGVAAPPFGRALRRPVPLPTRRFRSLPAVETVQGSTFRPPAAAFVQQQGGASSDAPSPYRNVDGMRHDDGRYTAFKSDVRALLGEERVVDDPVRTFAYGTDASFYRLTPQAVVKVHSEQEVVDVLDVARAHQTPVTFRAAGTSLSGQAITDSVCGAGRLLQEAPLGTCISSPTQPALHVTARMRGADAWLVPALAGPPQAVAQRHGVAEV